jgi:hypothetical protein
VCTRAEFTPTALHTHNPPRMMSLPMLLCKAGGHLLRKREEKRVWGVCVRNYNKRKCTNGRQKESRMNTPRFYSLPPPNTCITSNDAPAHDAAHGGRLCVPGEGRGSGRKRGGGREEKSTKLVVCGLSPALVRTKLPLTPFPHPLLTLFTSLNLPSIPHSLVPLKIGAERGTH